VEDCPTKSSSASTYLMLTFAMALFGSAFTGSKVLAGTVPPEVAALLRFGCGALVLLLWLGISGRGFGLSARDWGRIALAGALGVFAFNALFFWGLHLAPSIDGSLIVPVLSPVLTIAASALVLREGVSLARMIGLAVGVSGAVVFLLGVGGHSGGGRLVGDLVYVVGAVVWTAYILIGRRILVGIDPVKAIALATSVGSLMLAALAAPKLPSVTWSALSTGFWLNIVYLAIGPTTIAYVWFYRGIKAVGPANASIMMLLVPFFGATGGVLFLNETLSVVQAIGALLMLTGALLALTNGRIGRRRVEPTATMTAAAAIPASAGANRPAGRSGR
jgi:drug/metabolite transporter (DMT)-like permease